MALELSNRPVYRAPTARRCYLTIRAAASAEAGAMLNKKYPPERAVDDPGEQYYDPGWHWSNDDRLARVHKRLARLILRQFRAMTTPSATDKRNGQ